MRERHVRGDAEARSRTARFTRPYKRARRLPFLSQEPLAFLRNLGDLVKEVTKKLDLFILINYILYQEP